MSLRALMCLVLISMAFVSAVAAPFLPGSDNQVLERLPLALGDPIARDLRALHSQLTLEPDNLPLALRMARGYLELGRVTGDPRYAGYAQAALSRWWRLDQPPLGVLVLRAALRQRVHQFDAALADLARVLSIDPRNVQARLMRATVLQLQGAYEGARDDCNSLQALTRELVWVACVANVDGATGQLHESYRRLSVVFDRAPGVQAGVRVWALTSLAEMAARAGMAPEAETHFRAALALDAADTYLLGAYADFLLDSNRSSEVVALLRDKTSADPLLLRYALALQAQHSKELWARMDQLHERFAASRLRGDQTHLREEARFTLHLLSDASGALRLAQDNWRLQKEPADIRILLEASIAASDSGAVDAIADWLREARLEDVRLSSLISNNKREASGD